MPSAQSATCILPPAAHNTKMLWTERTRSYTTTVAAEQSAKQGRVWALRTAAV